MLHHLKSCLFGGLSIGAMAMFAVGCSTSTSLTDIWRDPSYAAAPMRNMLVFGGRMGQTDRHILEDAFVNALAMHGVHATPSYWLFPGELPDTNEARAAAQRAGVDGFLVASMRGVNEVTRLVPGYTGGFWDGYYGPGWGAAWGAGYVVSDTFVKFETSIWDARSGRLVWSALTETENPSSGRDFVKSVLNKVMPTIAKAGLVPPLVQRPAVASAALGSRE